VQKRIGALLADMQRRQTADEEEELDPIEEPALARIVQRAAGRRTIANSSRMFVSAVGFS
jgi:hypothetical protein